MKRDNRPSWRILLDMFEDDPWATIEGIKQYVRDVRGGASPIEALHGHVCSAECWHGQAGAVTWPSSTCACGSRDFKLSVTDDHARYCLTCLRQQRKVSTRRVVPCAWRDTVDAPRCGLPSTGFGLCDKHRERVATVKIRGPAEGA